MEENNRLEYLLGKILQRNGWITESQLNEALKVQTEGDTRPIGEILVKMLACTPDQLMVGVLQQYALLSAVEGE